MSTARTDYVYLAPDPKSSYKQLFIKGRRIRARTLYGWYMSEEDPATPEEIAEGYQIPLERSKRRSPIASPIRPKFGRILRVKRRSWKLRG
jgi:uncharacterized protein (DUF433 family)